MLNIALDKKLTRNKGDLLLPITIFLLMDLVSFSSRGFEEAQAELFSSDNFTRMLGLATCASLLVLSFLRIRSIYIPGKPIMFLFIFWVLGLVSMLNGQWFMYSAVKLFEYAIFIGYAFYIFNLEKRGLRAIERAFRYVTYFIECLVFSVVIGLIISPSKALYTGLNEYSAIRDAYLPFILSGWIVVVTSTSLGYFAAFLAYFQLVDIIRSKANASRILKLTFYFVVMILAQCRIAIIGFLIVSALVLLLASKKPKSIAFLAIVSILIFINSEYIITFFRRGQSNDMMLSLSGRTEWWSYALDYFDKASILQKLIGGGFAATEKMIAYQSNAAMYTLDSEFLAVLMSTGMLGVGAWGASIISLYRIILVTKPKIVEKKKQYDDLWFKAMGTVLMITLRMITTTTLAVTTYYLGFYLICSLVFQLILQRESIYRCKYSQFPPNEEVECNDK